MAEVFEYSDRLNSPVEAFYCTPENSRLPVGAHWHYFVEMLYLLEGSVHVICNGVSYRLSAGDLLLIPPQVVHSISRDSDHPYLYTCVKYSATHIRLVEGYLPNLHILFRNLMKEEYPPLLFSPDDFGSRKEQEPARDLTRDRSADPKETPTYLLMEEIIREVRQRPYGYLTVIFSRLTGLLLEILRSWYQRGIPLQTEPPSETDTLSIQDVAIYIDRHSHEALKVDDLAKMCNMSYSYFAKVFHRQYGQSCKQYIEFIRLTKAENLLLFTDHDLSAIAEETGFSDSSHLIRCFRRLYHTTPKQYRLQHVTGAF